MRIFFLTLAACMAILYQSDGISADTLFFGSFGKVVIYKPEADPESVVLFISGDGGWNKGVIDMARNVVNKGALVAGIDIVHYFNKLKTLPTKCLYPAGDFEELSIMLQKKYKLSQYHKPVLIGYSSGATLAYGLITQAPANTFKGAVALGFCPDIEISKPLCPGSGLKEHVIKEGISYYLEASEHLSAPFIVLQGKLDKACPFNSTQQFMNNLNEGELIALPKVGHGFAIQANWLPQFLDAYNKVLQAPSYMEQKAAQNSLLQLQHLDPLPGELPITLIPSEKTDSLPLVFMISGDGGWTSFDHTMGEKFAETGMPVVGLDAQKYFWNSKTPEETTHEIVKALKYYMQQWHRKNFILVGYSFGACIVPFVSNRIPEEMRTSMRGVFLLSPDETADFEIHISDMLSLGNSKDTFNVIEEIKKAKVLQPVCILGKEEDIELRSKLSEAGAKILLQPGDHHYNNNPAGVAEVIFRELVMK
jgi:type IV secretory pathway VirJ component